MQKKENKEKIDLSKIKLASGNENYIKQNLEYMEFIQKNKCKTVEVRNGKRK